MELTTWDNVHAGDTVLAHDGLTYGVVSIERTQAGPIIVLIRHGVRSGPAQPPPGTPITVLARADTRTEALAFQALADAGLGPEVIREIRT